MKTILIILFLLLLSPVWGALIDTNATTETQALYTQLQNAQGNYIYWGIQSNVNGSVVQDSEIYKITGKREYVYGDDFMSSAWYDCETFIPDARKKLLIKHYRNGGIITMSWHMKNYHTDRMAQSAWDTSAGISYILPGGDDRAEYLTALDTFATWCNNFKDDRGNLIPIIFRPYHENDKEYFWWGANWNTDAEYVSLWQDLVTYLRDTKGVHNLIYCYSPQVISGTYEYTGVLYPGDTYVDIFGIDRYSNDDNITNHITRFGLTSDEAESRGKVFAIVEGLRNLVTAPKDDYWTWYSNQILNNTSASRAAWVLTWLSPTWGPSTTRTAEAADFLTMSQNPKIKFLQYKTHLGKGTYGKGTWN